MATSSSTRRLGSAAAWPLAARAQQTKAVSRTIGSLTVGSAGHPFEQAFRQGLRDFGYVEGRNLVIEFRGADGQADRLTGLAAELASLKVDVFFASGSLVIPLPAPLMSRNAGRIAQLALQSRLPTIYYSDDFPKAGGLASYGASITAMHRRAAYFVDRILKGAKPAELPVEQPTKFDLVINLKTARALGLTVPQTLLATADEVIE
jgi:hypothetical protein